MNAPSRFPPPAAAELDVIAKAIARALARQHHAEALAAAGMESQHVEHYIFVDQRARADR